MRIQIPQFSTILFLLASQSRLSTSSPLFSSANSTLLVQERTDCTPCGTDGTACCASSETCYNDINTGKGLCSAPMPQITPAPVPNAQILDEYCDSCGGGTVQGSWVYWVSTYTSTDLVTYCSTFSSFVPAPTSSWVAPQTTAAAVQCDSWAGATPCGNICCASNQYCQWEGQCGAKTAYYQSSYYQTSYYNTYTAPLRPTSLVTSPVAVTTTVGFQPAVTTGANVTVSSTTSSSGLSAGAIAGIVIGVIAGLILLILIIMCCCIGAGIEGILAFFGIGGKRKETVRRTEEVEYYNRHGSRADGRTWYGGSRPPQNRPPPKKKSDGIGFAGIVAGLAAFAAALGLARRRERKKRDEKSDYSSSYVSYDYTDSTRSSDRRTRDTRRSRR